MDAWGQNIDFCLIVGCTSIISALAGFKDCKEGAPRGSLAGAFDPPREIYVALRPRFKFVSSIGMSLATNEPKAQINYRKRLCSVQ